MRSTFLGLSLVVGLAVGCAAAESPAPSPPRGSGGSGGSGKGSGGSVGGGTGGSVGGGSGGSSGSGGAAGTPGSGGQGDAGPVAGTDGGDSANPDPDAGGSEVMTPVPGGGPGPSPVNPAQGPVALGQLVYHQDFEQNRIGISLSPVNLPPERAVVVDDPLNKYGKVMRVIWQAGDNFRTSAGTQPRSWISNAKEGGVQILAGTKISIAWAQMFKPSDLDAFFAQTIGPGPVWELRLRADSTFNILCNKCGGNTEHMKIQPDRWYDFRVDMDWMDGGAVKFFVDGAMVREARVTGVGGAPCHWDGGIYNTPGGTASNRTSTVYIANLSLGKR